MGTIRGAASAEIDAPIAEVYAVCADQGTAPEWQDGLQELRILERDGQGRALIGETVNDAKVRQVRSRVRFSYDEPRLVAWTQVDGDPKSVDGAWELEDLGGGRTRATYRLEVDPGRILGMLIRGPIEGRLRQIMVEGRPQELRRRMESGGA
jgi:uncharacterized membrane protein